MGYNTLMFGLDAEFELIGRDGIISAIDVTPGCGEIGCDGSNMPLELRPQPSSDPVQVVENLRDLIGKVLQMDEVVAISAQGDCLSLGLHIHFGTDSGDILPPLEHLVRALDEYLYARFDGRHGTGRSWHYRRSGQVRDQKFHGGWEYRSLPGRAASSALLCRAVLKVAARLAQVAYSGGVIRRIHSFGSYAEAYASA